MIHEISKDAEKTKIILASNHRYFTRSVVISIINVILLFILTTGLAVFMIMAISYVVAVNPEQATSVTGITMLLIAALYIVNAASFIYSLVHLRKMHNDISQIEDAAIADKGHKNNQPKTKAVSSKYEEEYDLH